MNLITAQLFLSVMLLNAGFGLQSVLIPIRAQSDGFGVFTIGLLGAAYYVGFILGCVLVPRLIQRVGHIRTYAGFASLAAAVLLLHPIAPQPVIWLVMRTIVGFGVASMLVTAESWLNGITSNQHRGGVFATYMAATWMAIVIGNSLFGLWHPDQLEPFILTGVLVCLCVVPIAFTTMHVPRPEPLPSLSFKRLFNRYPLGAMGCLAIGLTNGTFWSLAPIFALEHGLKASSIGLFMAVVIVGGAITQWPLGRLSDHLDRRVAIASACILSSIIGLWLTLSFNNHPSNLLFISALCFGATSFPLYGLLVAHANDQAPEDAFIELSSGLLILYGLGAIAGPIMASVVMKYIGASGLFVFTAGIHLLLFMFSLYCIRTWPALTPEEKLDYVVTQRTTPEAVMLDPRAEEGV
jgi:MFS family permease